MFTVRGWGEWVGHRRNKQRLIKKKEKKGHPQTIKYWQKANRLTRKLLDGQQGTNNLYVWHEPNGQQYFLLSAIMTSSCFHFRTQNRGFINYISLQSSLLPFSSGLTRCHTDQVLSLETANKRCPLFEKAICVTVSV